MEPVVVKIGDGSWELHLHSQDARMVIISGATIDNFELKHRQGKYFSSTMVDAEATLDSGVTLVYQQPMLFEQAGKEGKKVGDIVIVLRKNPNSRRWMIKTSVEDIYVSEDDVTRGMCATRSSAHNLEQAIGEEVIHSGEVYSNPRRIGGLPIETHYLVTAWSFKDAGDMIDIYDFIRCKDALGLAAFSKAMAEMPIEIAVEILIQQRSSPSHL